MGSQWHKKYKSDVVTIGKRQKTKDVSLEDFGELRFVKKENLIYDLGVACHGSLDGQNGDHGSGGHGDHGGRQGRGSHQWARTRTCGRR